MRVFAFEHDEARIVVPFRRNVADFGLFSTGSEETFPIIKWRENGQVFACSLSLIALYIHNDL